MRRFQPARSLHLVAAKNFGIGDDDQLRFFEKKAAAKVADLNLQEKLLSPKPYSFQISPKRCRSPSLLQKTCTA